MAMTEAQLLEHVKDEIDDDADLAADSQLFSTGLLDSVAMTRLIMFIEEKAKIEVGMEDVTLDNFDSIERIMKFVESQS